MKIVISRKGLDASAGGFPSPILPDGSIRSLPIPDPHSPVRYRDIRAGSDRLGGLVTQLARGRLGPGAGAHLDPDLERHSVPRAHGFRPSLGQCGSAASHLDAHGVGPGDLFLFFGWFREVESHGASLRYRRGAPDLHLLFGWLAVGGVLDLENDRVPAWALDHPHRYGRRKSPNRLYVAARSLAIPGMRRRLPGAGVFPRRSAERTLTAPGRSRSIWALPRWFRPGRGRPALSYHHDPRRWQLRPGHCELHSAARGQEFVLDADSYPEASRWCAGLFAS